MSHNRAFFAPLFIVSLAAASFGLAGQAFAHAHLKSETPAANSTVASPEQLILKFSEGLEIKFTTVKVTGPDGKAAATSAPSLDPSDNTQSAVDYSQLVPMTDAIETNLGRKPEQLSAGSGYCSETNLEALESRHNRCLCGDRPSQGRGCRHGQRRGRQRN
jgi:copper resistance protein C